MAGFNPKHLIGKTIASVDMQRLPQDAGAKKFGFFVTTIQQITFTDGSCLAFRGIEMSDTDPEAGASYIPARRRKRKKG